MRVAIDRGYAPPSGFVLGIDDPDVHLCSNCSEVIRALAVGPDVVTGGGLIGFALAIALALVAWAALPRWTFAIFPSSYDESSMFGHVIGGAVAGFAALIPAVLGALPSALLCRAFGNRDLTLAVIACAAGSAVGLAKVGVLTTAWQCVLAVFTHFSVPVGWVAFPVCVAAVVILAVGGCAGLGRSEQIQDP